MSGVKDRLTDAGYGLGWSVVCRLPESWAQRGFRFAADLAWRRQGTGVQVLEGNLRRVIGGEASGGEASGGELRALSREAMRSYARYWLEVFRLPVMPVDRLVGGMRDTGHIRTAFEYLAAGREVVFALPHGQLGPGWRMDHRQRGRLPYCRDRAGEAGVGLRQVRRVPRGTRPASRRRHRAGSPDGAKRRPDAGARESRSPWPDDRARAGPGTGRNDRG